MSRGLGKTQRLALEVLAGKGQEPPGFRWASVFEIAHRGRCDGTLETDGEAWNWEWNCDKCHAARPTPAETESVRRALKKLASVGLIELAHFVESTGRMHEWVIRAAYPEFPAARKQIFARLPLTDEEAEGERLKELDLAKRLDALAAKYG